MNPRGSPRVIMLFLDGVGIGTEDDRVNPFFGPGMASLREILGGSMVHLGDSRRSGPEGSVVPLDATFGIPGLPQSGTGQTALFTGLDAPRIVGRHFGPYPYSTLRPLIRNGNIFSILAAVGKRGLYANAFPRQYHDHIAGRPSRMTVLPLSWVGAGNTLNDSTLLSRGKALSADITNERWKDLGYPEVMPVTPQEAGQRLVGMTEEADLVLFEYYVTDHAGHAQSMDEALMVLSRLDGLIEGILSGAGDEILLIVTSDHGNLEDLSTKSHTLNPVPLIARGAGHAEFVRHATNLQHVLPAILRLYRS